MWEPNRWLTETSSQREHSERLCNNNIRLSRKQSELTVTKRLLAPLWGVLTGLTWPVSPVFIMNNAESLSQHWCSEAVMHKRVFSLSVYTHTHTQTFHTRWMMWAWIMQKGGCQRAMGHAMQGFWKQIYQSKASPSPSKSFKLRFTQMIRRHAGSRQTQTCKEERFTGRSKAFSEKTAQNLMRVCIM